MNNVSVAPVIRTKSSENLLKEKVINHLTKKFSYLVMINFYIQKKISKV